MSDNEEFDVENVAVGGYQFEPVRQVLPEMADELFEEVDTRRPVKEWCSCGQCSMQPTEEQNVCCMEHQVREKLEPGMTCITKHSGVYELTRPAVLEVMYNGYLCLHEDLFDETRHSPNSKNRFCSYRALVFWLYPDIRRHERRPLPACLYGYVQAMFPPTDSEEEFADWEFTKFVYDVDIEEQSI